MSGVKGRGGSNRKSLAEHRLVGSVRPSRHRGWTDPPPAPVAPVVKPSTLSARASAAWDELAPLAIAMGTLTAADVMAFSTLCELLATQELAWREKGAEGFVPVSVGGRVHPALKLERDTAGALRPYWALFGFTGPDRARLHTVPPAQAPANPLDRFLVRKQSKWSGVLP